MAKHTPAVPALRRSRALLAGATVLGLGSVGTLALWTDVEFGSAIFHGMARFRVEAATNVSGPWEPYGSVGEAATLAFDFPAGGLVEGEPVRTEFWLRMDTEVPGNVRILAPTVEESQLDGRITVAVTQGSCVDPGMELQQGLLEELTDADLLGTFDLPGGVDGQPGQAQAVCITATLGDISDLPPGEYSTGRVLWEFVVTEVRQ